MAMVMNGLKMLLQDIFTGEICLCCMYSMYTSDCIVVGIDKRWFSLKSISYIPLYPLCYTVFSLQDYLLQQVTCFISIVYVR